MVILSSDKKQLHQFLYEIKEYLNKLELTIKDNYQIFPVESRGIDFIGYRFKHTHILLRKQIKKNIKRCIRDKKLNSFPSYYGRNE